MLDVNQSDCFLAHSANGAGTGVPETMRDHLRAVADTAAAFARPFGAEEQAYAAGLCHDLGKYADQFQKRLQDRNEPSRNHWSVGAALLASLFHQRGVIPALAVAAHHTGLAQVLDARAFGEQVVAALKATPDQFTEINLATLWQRFLGDGFQQPAFSDGLVPSKLLATNVQRSPQCASTAFRRGCALSVDLYIDPFRRLGCHLVLGMIADSRRPALSTMCT